MRRAGAALARGRRLANRKMVDRCRITDPGAKVTDPETGKVTVSSTTIYEGKCEVSSDNASSASPEAGGKVFTVVSRKVKIPADAADVRDGHVVEITASAHNVFAVGRKYRVDGYTPDTYATTARLPVKELTS